VDFFIGEHDADGGRHRVTEYRSNTRTKPSAHSPPLPNSDSALTILSSGGWTTTEGTLYTFTRSLAVPQGSAAFDLRDQTQQLFMIWAYCGADFVNTTLDYHDESKSGKGTVALTVNNFWGTPCDIWDCNSNGVCNNGLCMCNPWFLPPTCTQKGNGVTLIPGLELRWAVDSDRSLVNMTLYQSNYTGWAGIGLRTISADARMDNANFFVGQWINGLPSVSEHYPNMTKNNGKTHPIQIPADQSSIVAGSFGGFQDGRVGAAFWWSRRMIATAPQTIAITSGSSYYIVFAYCNTSADQAFRFHGDHYATDDQVAQVTFIDAASNAVFPQWGYFVIGGGVFLLALAIGYCICKKRGEGRPAITTDYTPVQDSQ